MENDKKCAFILKNGSRCGMWSLKGSEYCFTHDPHKKQERFLANKKGGLVKEIVIKTPLEPVVINSCKDTIALLTRTINEVRTGKMDYRIANTVAYLANCLIKAYEVCEIQTKVEQVRAIMIERKIQTK